MDVVNRIYAMPVAKNVLFEHQWTEGSKIELALVSDKMYQNFVEDLRKMENRQQKESLQNEEVHTFNEDEAVKWLTKDTLFGIQWLPADITLISKIEELI